MTDVIAPVTSFLRDPTVLGDSIFAGVQDVPPKDPYGGIRAKNIATVMANIASRGGELKLTQEACVVGVQDVISVNWDARHSHEPSVVFSWCTAVYNCLQVGIPSSPSRVLTCHFVSAAQGLPPRATHNRARIDPQLHHGYPLRVLFCPLP